MLTAEQEQALLSGADCNLHYHSEDQHITRDQLQQLEDREVIRIITASGAITYKDDILLLDSTSGAQALTLPTARGGKRYIFTRVAGGNAITLSRTGTDTINGATTLVISTSYSPVRLKAVKGLGWVTV